MMVKVTEKRRKMAFGAVAEKKDFAGISTILKLKERNKGLL